MQFCSRPSHLHAALQTACTGRRDLHRNTAHRTVRRSPCDGRAPARFLWRTCPRGIPRQCVTAPSQEQFAYRWTERQHGRCALSCPIAPSMEIGAWARASPQAHMHATSNISRPRIPSRGSQARTIRRSSGPLAPDACRAVLPVGCPDSAHLVALACAQSFGGLPGHERPRARQCGLTVDMHHLLTGKPTYRRVIDRSDWASTNGTATRAHCALAVHQTCSPLSALS